MVVGMEQRDRGALLGLLSGFLHRFGVRRGLLRTCRLPYVWGRGGVPAQRLIPACRAERAWDRGRTMFAWSSVVGRYREGMSEVTMTPESLALRELVAARREKFQALLERYGATNPKLCGSVAHGTAHSGSDVDILVEMDPADGNLLMRASGLMEETRELFGRDDIDVFPAQLLKRPISASALAEALVL